MTIVLAVSFIKLLCVPCRVRTDKYIKLRVYYYLQVVTNDIFKR